MTFGWLFSLGQSDDYSKVLQTRSNGVYEHYQDLFIATILSGKGYYLDYKGAKRSPYFGDNGLEFGTLIYDGVTFRNIAILYNLYTQQLVVQHESKNDTQLVILDSDKVSEFSINKYEFVNIRMDSVMNSGIYQLAYRGLNSSLFVKRTMDKDEEFGIQEVTLDFSPKNEYYIINNLGSFLINSKKGLMKAYNNSPRLLSIMKENKIRFSKNLIENGLITVLSLLDPKIEVSYIP